MSAKAVGVQYKWWWDFTYPAASAHASDNGPGPIHEGPGEVVPYALEDGDTLTLDAGIYNIAFPVEDSSYATDEVTCTE